jgi:hypothetical protein
MGMDEPHILPQATETGILGLSDEGIFNFEKNTQQPNTKANLQLVLPLTHISFFFIDLFIVVHTSCVNGCFLSK